MELHIFYNSKMAQEKKEGTGPKFFQILQTNQKYVLESSKRVIALLLLFVFFIIYLFAPQGRSAVIFIAVLVFLIRYFLPRSAAQR